MIQTTHFRALLLAASLAAPGAALAQRTDPPAPASTPATAQGRRAAVEQRIADIHASLHIIEAQEPAFDQFAQVMLDNAQTMDALVANAAAGAPTRSADQAMEDYANLAEQHGRDMRRLAAAFHDLYTALPAEQRKDADAMFQQRAAARAQARQGD